MMQYMLLLICTVLSNGLPVAGRVSGARTGIATAELFWQIKADLEPYAKCGVSKAMVDGVYCGIRDGGFRVQIKDNRIYIAGEVAGIQSRNRSVKLQLLGLAMRYDNLPDVDFVVGTGDCPGLAVLNVTGMSAGGPVFAQAKKKEHSTAVLYPDHTFTDWMEASAANWPQQQFLMHEAAQSNPWISRKRQLLFRGNSVTRNGHIAAELQKTNELDVHVWDWIQDKEGFLGLTEHCKNKYLLNWPGNSYSARYKYLLLCGSVVLHADNGYYEFFYPMLKHEQHVIQLQNLASKRDFDTNLTNLIKRLEAQPDQSKQIAETGQRFATSVLTSDSLTAYWFRLLKAYAALQHYRVQVHDDAITLGSSLSNPVYMDVETRSGCGH